MLNKNPVVLVHGLWHGSWCWSLVTGALAARGVPSLAVDLEGHDLRSGSPQARWARPFDPAAFATEASPVASVTASSAAQTLVAQLRRAGGARPCVVVADGPAGIAAETLTVTRQRYGSVPHTYIVCAADRGVPAALQRRFAREIDAVSVRATKVVELDTSYSPFLSAPGELADTIAAANC